MKKISLVFLFSLLLFLIPFSSASAASFSSSDIEGLGYQYIKGTNNSDKPSYIVWKNKPDKVHTFYVNNQYFFYPNESNQYWLFVSDGSGNFTASGYPNYPQSVSSGSNTEGLKTVEKTTFDIYKDSTYKSVFFFGTTTPGGGDNSGNDGSPGGWWDSFTGLDSLSDWVGDLIGSTLGILVQPLEWIGNAFDSVASAVGSGFDSMVDWFGDLNTNLQGWFNSLGTNISSWFSNLVDNISSFSSSVGTWFSNLGDNIGGWFTDLFDGLSTWFADLFKNLGDLLSYINPLSDKFFLWIAFIPDDNFFHDYSDDFSYMIETKFGFLFQIRDTFNASVEAIKSNVTAWDGLSIDLSKYGGGEVDIINPHAVGYYSEKVKFWIGGLMIFLTSAWLIRKLSLVLGAGR